MSSDILNSEILTTKIQTTFNKFNGSANLRQEDSDALLEIGKGLSEFLKAFFPDQDEIINISQLKPKQAPPLQETYVNGKTGKERNKEANAHWTKSTRITRKDLETDIKAVLNLVNQGMTRGTYFIVNAGGTVKNEIKRINAWFCENDTLSIEEQLERLNDCPLPPSVLVIAKKSVHAYWLVRGDCIISEWENIQKRLIAHFDGDKSLINANRLMRLPFFDHVKFTGENARVGDENDTQRFLNEEPDKHNDYDRKNVELKEIHLNRRYTLQQMQEAFADIIEPEISEETRIAKERIAYVSTGIFPHWIDELREYFYRNGNKTTNGYELSCPSCGDVSSTTAFMYQDGGFKCHKNGCDARQIAQAVGIDVPVYKELRAKNSAGLQIMAEHFTEIEEVENNSSLANVGMNGLDFMNADFPSNEPILFGVRRGQIGMLNAVAHTGKTMFFLNLMLSLVGGMKFEPFIDNNSPKGLKVMLIDGESSKQELKYVLEKQTQDWTRAERDAIFSNIHIVCDDEFEDELLNLSNPKHREKIEKIALEFNPDLILIDTVSASFNMRNENDNAEIKKEVMMPIKELAKRADAAVFMTHHIGKMSEDSNISTKVYSGRGGSAFGSLARTIITLTKDKNNKQRVIFSMPKIKGKQIEDTVLEFSPDSFWYSVINEQPPKNETVYSQVIGLINNEMPTHEIIKLGGGFGISKSSVEKALHQAVTLNEIKQIRHGVYAPTIFKTINAVNSLEDKEITEDFNDLGVEP